ncbi:MAG: hypothetical protein ACKKL4_03015 [Patescibacteria group bacterium]
MKFLCSTISIALLAFPFFSFGQAQSMQSVGTIGLSNSQAKLQQRPRIVQPNQNVQFEVVSYNTDINRAQVEIYLNDILVSQGLGLKNFTVPAPSVGEQTRVRVVIRTVDRGTIEKYAVLRPARVDLLYEATNSYAPPMYSGKKLPAHEGGVRVVAMPYFVNDDGVKIDPGSLVYTWRIDDDVQERQSGYGRNIFEFDGSPYYRTREVTVNVETVDASQVAQRTIELPAYDPVVRFYIEHPVWGMDMSQAITADETLALRVPEIAVHAVPFFVSDTDSRQLVSYEWRMNGKKLNPYGDRNIVNLRVPDNSEGRSEVRLDVTHNNKILQIARALFRVEYGKDEEGVNMGRNFFGIGG